MVFSFSSLMRWWAEDFSNSMHAPRREGKKVKRDRQRQGRREGEPEEKKAICAFSRQTFLTFQLLLCTRIIHRLGLGRDVFTQTHTETNTQTNTYRHTRTRAHTMFIENTLVLLENTLEDEEPHVVQSSTTKCHPTQVLQGIWKYCGHLTAFSVAHNQ